MIGKRSTGKRFPYHQSAALSNIMEMNGHMEHRPAIKVSHYGQTFILDRNIVSMEIVQAPIR